MPSNDPYLRPGLTPATDVELYASEAAGGTTTPVAVSTTATGVAAVSLVVARERQFAATATGVAGESHTFTPAPPLPPPPSPSVGRASRVIPPAPLPIRFYVHASAVARGVTGVTIEVIPTGRIRQDDELLLLVGAF